MLQVLVPIARTVPPCNQLVGISGCHLSAVVPRWQDTALAKDAKTLMLRLRTKSAAHIDRRKGSVVLPEAALRSKPETKKTCRDRPGLSFEFALGDLGI